MVFIVAPYATWCPYLESLKGATLQFFADNLECNSCNSEMLLSGACLCERRRAGGFSQQVRASSHFEGCPQARDCVAKWKMLGVLGLSNLMCAT